MKLRIDKFMADMGIGTRSDIKNYIKAHRISINGKTVKSPGEKADTVLDNVIFDGQEIQYLEYEYYMINKPAGVISATEDKHTKTVMDLIDSKRGDLFPVGRLDKDTEGLLILTNDGMLAHNMLSPKKHVDKTYYVRTDNELKSEYTDMFLKGLVVEEGFVALPADLKILSSSETGSEALLTIREGKFHQVKRMMEAVDNKVTYLKRISMGPIELPKDLGVGEYRKLTKQEIEALTGKGE